MIISGVHGDELAGVEVVETLLPSLKTANRAFSLMVVPRVLAKNCLTKTRYTPPGTRDPNRQMPEIGTVGTTSKFDGKPMEPENQALVDLLQRFQPERLVSVHGTSNRQEAGVFSDPRPGSEDADRKLALDMARAAFSAGASVPGDHLGTKDQTATYYPPVDPKKDGISLGIWGSRSAGTRPAINIITVETAGKPATGSPGAHSVKARDALVKAILDVFLSP